MSACPAMVAVPKSWGWAFPFFLPCDAEYPIEVCQRCKKWSCKRHQRDGLCVDCRGVRRACGEPRRWGERCGLRAGHDGPDHLAWSPMMRGKDEATGQPLRRWPVVEVAITEPT